jgi:dipeptidyl-peptidase-3
MKRTLALAAFSLTLLAATPAKKTPATSLVERIGKDGFIRVEANSFAGLTPKQKELAYWLTQASIAIDPIFYDQMSPYGLTQKYILELIVSHPKGVDAASLAKIKEFTKLFWGHHGNHNDNTGQKFVPTFTPEELETAALIARANSKSPYSEAEIRQQLTDIRASLFDPQFESQVTVKNPPAGSDIIQASANNFYARGVSLSDLQNFQETHPLNSRVAKTADGKVVEEVWRAGTADGSVAPGRYAVYLKQANDYLRKAAALADAKQAKVINALVRYYETGDPKDWIAFGVLWVQNDAHVDLVNGFIEVYRDARGAKGSASSFVSITDVKMASTMKKLTGAAQYFEQKAPWSDEFKNPRVTPPVAKAVETLIETGDFSVTTVGQNLPNEDEIHDQYGTKNFMFSSSTRAINSARGTSRTGEFAYDDAEKQRALKYGAEAGDLHTSLHEVIGHGSGKVRVTGDPATYLKEYYSTLEEARADLMSLWNAWDPKMKELGLVSNQEEVAKTMYDSSVRVALTQLTSVRHGETIEEDHARNRQLIVEYIMDKVPGSIERTTRNGKSYLHILDYHKVHEGVGKLLGELMRIKGEGDYPAIKALIDRYGVHFDPKLRDEVVARYDALNTPTYWHGIAVDLHRAGPGKVTMTKAFDLTAQRLRWAAMYHPEVAP